ncbi:hypothetical protein [Methylobacterium nodulans]|uniref:Uncharacterized protein n=1 Tax=Methylobacterium nodulans (strain LMG 21967 / CNCM I-2342 / ORS 2060) TaxID=460265 RepID=B8IQP9_METNO|nr:hypothetical protein [Methylobacterium nodulans]ACL62344.1 hypothetical protein Mnod_7609 [Methylobacterium nodulans ORS 2060]
MANQEPDPEILTVLVEVLKDYQTRFGDMGPEIVRTLITDLKVARDEKPDGWLSPEETKAILEQSFRSMTGP